MLGRALPLRDHKTGQILKWFGTCTDIHDRKSTFLPLERYRLDMSSARKPLVISLEHCEAKPKLHA